MRADLDPVFYNSKLKNYRRNEIKAINRAIGAAVQ